jgi:uncharacterized protein
MRILITGGTGLVGGRLAEVLRTEGHIVRILSRRKSDPDQNIFHWNYRTNELDERALEKLNAVVHLAGKSVASGRWTMERKQDILDSRVRTADLILRKLQERNQIIQTYIGASATGFYGNRPNETMTELSPKGNGFLSDVCLKWEKSASYYGSIRAEVFVNRIGVVLSENGGFVKQMFQLFRLKLASELGSGKQKMSWIHLEDLVEIIRQQISGELPSNTYNAVAPNPVTHHEMMSSLAKKCNTKIWLPNMPKWFLKLIFGELALELTANQEALPVALKNQGFNYKYPVLQSAVDALKK